MKTKKSGLITKIALAFICVLAFTAGFITLNQTPPTQTAHAITTEHADHTGYTKWTPTTSLPQTAGKYYLANNVTVTNTVNISNDVTLCLNGKTVSLGSNYIDIRETFTVCDCNATGGSIEGSGTCIINNRGTFNLYQGTLKGTGAATRGVNSHSCVAFNMYGGTIETGNRGVLARAGTTTIYDGIVTATKYYALCAESGGELNILGGNFTSAYDTFLASESTTNVYISGSPTFTSTEGKSTAYLNNYSSLPNIYLHKKGDTSETFTGGLNVRTFSASDGIVIFKEVDSSQISNLAYYGTSSSATSPSSDWGLRLGTGENASNLVLFTPHTHTGVAGEFTEWTATDSLPTTAGNYYLSNDVTLSNTWAAPTGETNLCLNGYSINLNEKSIQVSDGTTLNLYDCNGANKTNYGWWVETEYYSITDSAILSPNYDTLTGGVIYNAGSSNTGAIYVSGSFSMNGGNIAGNPTSGVDISTDATFTMNGGKIIGNNTIYGGGGVKIGINSTFIMNGGEISSNIARNGGGIQIGNANCAITLAGGSIINNVATNAGGGVNNPNGARINITGQVNITGNKVGEENCNLVSSNINISCIQTTPIGISPKDALSAGGKFTFTCSLANAEEYLSSFVADNSDYELIVNTISINKYLALRAHAHDFTSGSTCSCGLHSHDSGTTLVTELTDLSQFETSGNYYLGDTIPAVSSDIEIKSGVEITLCLNGKTLDLDNERILNEGTLTICDCHTLEAEQGKITSKINAYNAGTVQNFGGKLYITGGKIENTLDNNQPSAVYNTDNGVVEITGGTIYAYKGNGITNYQGTLTLQNCTVQSEEYYAVNVKDGKVYIKEGAEILGASIGIYTSNSGTMEITISGGSISSTSEYGYGIYNFGTLIISGGEITANNYGVSNSAVSTTTISGGQITGKTGVANYGSMNISGTPNITGTTMFGIENEGDLTISGNPVISAETRGIENKGTLKISGGEITGNNYGIFSSANATADISGGQITGKTGVVNYGSMNISGGTITGNATSGYGVNNNGVINISGGTIVSENYYGLFSGYAGDKVYLSKTPQISGELAGVYCGSAEFYAHDSSDNPEYYSGDVITFDFGYPKDKNNTVIIQNAKEQRQLFAVNDFMASYDYFFMLGGEDTVKNDIILHQHIYTNNACVCGAHKEGDEIYDKVLTVVDNQLYINHVEATLVGSYFDLPAGNYVLAEDINLSYKVRFVGNSKLCLNGKTIAKNDTNNVEIKSSASLEIKDCSSGQLGQISATVINDGTLKLTGGNIAIIGNDGWLEITAGTVSGRFTNNGTVSMNGGEVTEQITNSIAGRFYFAKGNIGFVSNSGTFTMTGGTINVQAVEGISNNGTFNLNGGLITGSSRAVTNYKTFTMSGGEISAPVQGVFNTVESTFTMTGGTISNCSGYAVFTNQTAYLKGGLITDCWKGVQIGSSSLLEMTGGEITNCDYGVYNNSGKFNMNGGEISGCETGVLNLGTFNMTSGTVSGCDTGVWNQSTMTMTGGSITNNVKLYGGIYSIYGTVTLNGEVNISGNKVDLTSEEGGIYNIDITCINGEIIIGEDFENLASGKINVYVLEPTEVATPAEFTTGGAEFIEHFAYSPLDEENTYFLRASGSDLVVHLAVKLTFEANGGQFEGGAQTVFYGVAGDDFNESLIPVATRTGYTLIGYGIDGQAITEEDWQEFVFGTEDITVKAIWQLNAPVFEEGDAGYVGSFDGLGHVVGKRATHDLSGTNPIVYTVYKWNGISWVQQTETNGVFNVKNVAHSGKYKVTASITANGEYASEDIVFTVEIVKAQVNKPAEDATVFIYNGEEQTYTLAENFLYIIGDCNMTNAGVKNITVSLKDTSNYEWADGSIEDLIFTFAINKQMVEKPTADSAVFTYSGFAQTYVIAESELYQVANNIQTNAGVYTVTVALKDNNNYMWADETVSDLTFSFAIGKANAEITVDTTDIVKTYGDAWSLPVASSNFGTVECNKVIGDLINANTYTVTYTVAGTSNYNGDVKTINVTINKATFDMSGIVFENSTVKYNGETHSLAIGGTLPNGVTVEYDGNGKTLAGVYTITANFIYDTANYNVIEPMSATLTINQDKVIDHIGEATNEKPHVEVTAEGGFEPSIEIVISEVSAKDNEVEEQINIFDKVGAVYDVIMQSDGVTVQPSGKITIKLLIPENLMGKDFRIYHNHNGEFTEIEYTVEGDYAVFTVDKLSEFSFVYYQFPWWIVILVVAIIGGCVGGYFIFKNKKQKKA